MPAVEATSTWLIETLQLNHVFTSYWFLLLAAWLLLSLIVTTYDQGIKELRRNQTYRPLPERQYRHQHALPLAPGLSLASLHCDQLKEIATREAMALGYQPVRRITKANQPHILTFAKNPWSRWGGVTFHAGLAVVIASALFSALSYNRSYFKIQEGTALLGNSPLYQQTSKGPLAQDLTFDFDLKLQSLQVQERENGHLDQLVSSVVMINHDDSTSRALSLAIGSPLTWHGVTVYQTWWYSYVLTCLLRGPGREQTMTFFVLNPPTDATEKVHGGRSTYPNSDYTFEIRLSPLHGPATGEKQPALTLKITDETGTIFFQGDVDPSQPLAIGQDTLQIVDIALWSGISVVRDPGTPTLYTGFILIVIGGVGLFLRPARELHLCLHRQEQQVTIRCGGRSSNHDAAIDDDIEALLSKIAKADIVNVAI